MNKNVTLNIPDWKHKILLKKVDNLKTALRFFKINEAFKKAFMDDVFSIEGIIKQSKKEMANGKTPV